MWFEEEWNMHRFILGSAGMLLRFPRFTNSRSPAMPSPFISIVS
jgi:hypothetical protein